MFSSFNKDNIFIILDKISESLTHQTGLTVTGDIVCVLIEHPTKEVSTMEALASFSQIPDEFEIVCQKLQIGFNSEGSDITNIRVVSLDVGKFKEERCISVYKTKNLEVRIIPPENVIASKLIELHKEDLDDCVFLIRKFRLSAEKIKQTIKTLKSKESRKAAMKNFVLLEASQAFDNTPYNVIRERVKRKLLINKTAEGLRNRYVDVVSFLLSGKSPSELLINRKFDTYRDLIEYIREGQPDFTLALHDPEMYKKLRNRVTELICQGWI